MDLCVMPTSIHHPPFTVHWEGVAAAPEPVTLEPEPVSEADADPTPSESEELAANLARANAEDPVPANPVDEDDSDDDGDSDDKSKGKKGWLLTFPKVTFKRMAGCSCLLIVSVVLLVVVVISGVLIKQTMSGPKKQQHFDVSATEPSDQPPVVDMTPEQDTASPAVDNWMSELDIPADWDAEFRDDRVCIDASKIEEIKEQYDIPFIVHSDGCMVRPSVLGVLKKMGRYP